MLSRTALLVIVITLLFSMNLQAKMYRWVDESGVTVYSQTPPPGKSADEIKVAPSRPATNDAKQEKSEPANDTTSNTTADEELARKKAESDKIKQENCAAARHNLGIYKDAGNKLIKNPDGLYERLTDEERQKRIEKAQQNVNEFCGEK